MDSVSYFIKNKLIGWICIVLSLFFGAFAYLNSARFEDPEFLIRTAQIVTEYPGATVQQVAEEVSDEIETGLQAMQEVATVRSISYPGMSIVSVDIKNAFSKNREQLNLVWARLRDRVTDTQTRLPPDAGIPVVKDDWGDLFGLYYMITGNGYSLKELYDYIQELRKRLLAVPGVAKVAIIGNQEEVIAVEISRGRIAALGLNIYKVFEALAQQNTVVASGDFHLDNQRIKVQPTGAIDSLAEIRNLAISFNSGNDVIHLSDIANIVREDIDPARIQTRFNGKAAIAFGISTVSGANVAEVGRGVRELLAETLHNRPLGMEINEFYHQGDVVDKSAADFARNTLLALLIILITLWLFMGLRPAIVIGSVLMTTAAATLAIMYVMNIPLHRISMGALIIALGIIVDNAIIVVHGILEGRNRGLPLIAAAKATVKQTKWPLLGGTLVGIIAFAPIELASGNVAEYCQHLFEVILISLCLSWLLAISLAPMLTDMLIGKETATVKASRALMLYKQFLRYALKLRWLVVALTIGLLLIAVWSFQLVKVGFFPTSNIPQIAIDYWLPEGSDISATARDIKYIEQAVMSLENVESLHSVVGQAALRFMLIYPPEQPNAAFGQLILKINEYREINPLIDKIQSYIDQNFPAAQARVWRFRLGPGQGSSTIEASFSGPDPKVLRQIAARAENILRSTPGAVAVKSDWRQMLPVYQPVYAPSRGSRLGVSRENYVHSIKQNLSGETIGFFRDGTDLLRIISRAPPRERSDIFTLINTQAVNAINGKAVPLSEVSDGVEIKWHNGLMLREDRDWTLKVQADPARGMLSSELLQRVKPDIEAISLPPGYTLEWQGEYGDSKTAKRELALTLPLAFLAMTLVVVLMFKALRQAAIIWLIVPLGMIGVVIGFVVTGTNLAFMAILGILSLSGLIIKNAILMVDQMDTEIRHGTPRFDAVIVAAASRVKPIMVISLTTVLGVLPLTADLLFAPMALVLAVGLICATALTLIVLPTLYIIIFSIKNEEIGGEEALEAKHLFNKTLVEASPPS